MQTIVYVKDLRRHFDAIHRLHAEYFGKHRPTSTLLGVVDLALPDQLVEISAIANLSAPAQKGSVKAKPRGKSR